MDEKHVYNSVQKHAQAEFKLEDALISDTSYDWPSRLNMKKAIWAHLKPLTMQKTPAYGVMLHPLTTQRGLRGWESAPKFNRKT